MTDRYTKVCLTVIAIALVAIAIRGVPTIGTAEAGSGVQKVIICDARHINKCANVRYGELQVD